MADQFDRFDVAKELFPEMPAGFPYEDFDMEELILPTGDDMGLRSDEDDIKEDEVQTDTGFGSCIGEAAAAPAARVRLSAWMDLGPAN